MNKVEHLLICAAEECAEIQQAISKALRFGLDDGSPDRTTTNAEDITKELHDLIGVMELLDEEKAVPCIDVENSEAMIEAKKAKVHKYISYAAGRGKLRI